LERGQLSGVAGYVSLGSGECLPHSPALLETSDLIRPILTRLAAFQPLQYDQRHQRLSEVLIDELMAAKPMALRLPFPTDGRLRSMTESLIDGRKTGWTLERWAGELNMTPKTLSRRFRAETGLPIKSWRRIMRLIKAQEHLAEGVTVQEAAWEEGYQNVSAFIGAFKKAFGLTPKSWVKMTGARPENGTTPDGFRSGALKKRGGRDGVMSPDWGGGGDFRSDD
jgi:AraC-like DNA-binding protein